MQLVIKSIMYKHLCHNLYPRHDLYSRKTYLHASAADMVGSNFRWENITKLNETLMWLVGFEWLI